MIANNVSLTIHNSRYPEESLDIDELSKHRKFSNETQEILELRSLQDIREIDIEEDYDNHRITPSSNQFQRILPPVQRANSSSALPVPQRSITQTPTPIPPPTNNPLLRPPRTVAFSRNSSTPAILSYTEFCQLSDATEKENYAYFLNLEIYRMLNESMVQKLS